MDTQQSEISNSRHITKEKTFETMKIPGRFLVRGDHVSTRVAPLLASNVSLSFWGGIDPVTGIVIDASHPLAGQSVTDTVLCLPSGRGSCTASQVLLELILNGISPRAIVLRDLDGLVAVGALVAQEIFHVGSMDILHVGEEGYRQLLENPASHAVIASNGELVIGNSMKDVQVEAQCIVGQGESSSSPVTFTGEEERMLQECETEAERMALKVVIQYAHLSSDTPSYLPVAKAHIDGCTYIGPGGLALAQRLAQADGLVAVPTTLNSVSTDRQRWQALGVPETYAKNAIALGDAYLQLGCQPSFTCAPYLLDDAPQFGQDLVWGESNAVVYANSVLGARTEKYADYLDICCAIAGMVPAAGVHLPINRRPGIVLDATELLAKITNDNEIDLDMLFPILGHLCGTLSDGKVPLLMGLDDYKHRVTTDHLKAFCAAFGTTASSPLIHIAHVTPEAIDPTVVAEWVESNRDNTVLISLSQLKETFQTLDADTSADEKVDLIALGNPHLSVSECKKLVELFQKETVGTAPQKHDSVRVIACVSRAIHSQAREAGHIDRLEEFGVEFVNDTCWCMLLDPPVIPTDPNARIMTNSGKYAHYGPGLTARNFRFGSTTDCIRAAVTGVYPKKATKGGQPSWLRGRAIDAAQRRTYAIITARLLSHTLRRWR